MGYLSCGCVSPVVYIRVQSLFNSESIHRSVMMKKLLVVMFSATLFLAGCGDKDESGSLTETVTEAAEEATEAAEEAAEAVEEAAEDAAEAAEDAAEDVKEAAEEAAEKADAANSE